MTSDPMSWQFGGMGLDPGMSGMGSGLVPSALQPGPLGLSPDFSDATAPNRVQLTPDESLQRSFQNPLTPFIPPAPMSPGPQNALTPPPTPADPSLQGPLRGGLPPVGPTLKYNSQGVPYNPQEMVTIKPGVNIPARPSWEPAPGPDSPVLPPPSPQTVTVPPHMIPGGAATTPPAGTIAGPTQPAVPYNKYDIIRHFEGGPVFSPTPDTDGSHTIAYGHTIQSGESFPNMDAKQAEDLLQQDIQSRIKDISGKFPGFTKLSSNQQEALISYYYNTGFLPGKEDLYSGDGNIQGIGAAIRAGPYTARQPDGTSKYMHMLEVRRNAEADLFGLPDGQNIDLAKYGGGYASGAPVHGSVAPSGKPYVVGGAAAGVATPPPQYGLTTPFMSDNPFAPRPPGVPGGPAQDLSELNQRDRTFRALQLWSILGAMQKGAKFTPIAYDPFKVRQAGETMQTQSIAPVQPPGPIQSAVSAQSIPRTSISRKIEGI